MTTFDQPSDISTARSQDRAAMSSVSRTTRWGPPWVGAIVALPMFLVLQMLFVAFGWIALGVDGASAGVAASIVSAVLAIIALFIGGAAGGTASSWSGTSANTALQGAMTWALTTVGVLALGLLGGGVLAGNLGGITSQLVATGPQRFAGNPAAAAEAIQAIQNGAGWAALWLGVAFIAAVVGTGVGAAATKGVGSATDGHGGDRARR